MIIPKFPVKFGTALNNTEFEPNGVMKANGEAATYDDIAPIPVINSRVGGTAPSSNPFALAVGIHIQQDTLGSRAEYAK